ncbi:MAG: AAA family ATPase, partial [Cyanobacteria bacterium J06631_9]
MTHGNLVTLPGYAIQACTYNSSRTQVYRAVSDADQQPVIVKVSGEGHLAANSSSLLRHQYALSQQLAHPGLVDITALIPFKGRYAIVMPDDGSVSLSQYLQQQAKRQQAEGIGSSVALSVTEVLSIGVQIADVLHYLWQQRIIHKDIKPANILIHPQNKQVKLIDFSIASQLPSETQMLIPPDLLEGTLAYIAPEQTGRMNRGIDYRSDFYALGVTLYQLLTGQLPFESEDPLELVHCHLAKQPLSVTALRPDVPEPVAAIVTKLMAKTAEGRYQSATGLQADLETCLHEWKDTGAVSDFVPGRLDNIAQFNIPQRLYGRNQAVKQLLSAFERVCQGGFELVVVKGCSGIGKTALIQELLGCLTEYRGYFSAGKYDQLQRDAPLAVPVKTLRQSVQQLLTEPSERLDYWRDRILNSLGENTRLIINTIPELELIVGPQPEVSQLEGTAAAMRFGETFNRFAQCLSGPDHPYVCFLDDWQWADGASFEMFPHFATDPRNGYYLAGIAYRDNEVSPTHPLMRMLETIRQAGVSITEIHLEPLGCADVARLVADTLHRDPAEVAPLSDVLFQKTEGNPFFLTQMLTSLHGEGLISFEPASKQWQWNLDAIVAEQSPVQVAQELHTTLHTSSSTLAAWLDVETFVKAAKALSSEIMLDRLLEKLLQLMLENAAAQKGCIVLEQAGDWVVEVVDVEMNAQVVEQRGITVAASTEVPQSLIHYVARTGQPQVVADARKAPTLQADPYIQQQQPRSLLVLPMRHQGQTVGIVYLENNLATDAFTPERVEILNLLASQAVIALQNARLYQQSQESQRKMAAVLSSMPGMAYSCLNDEDWTMEYASDGCLNLTGYSPDDLVHNKIIAYAELIHPEDEAMVAEVVGAAVEAYQPYQLTYRITTRDGKEKWVWEQGQALYNEDDEIVVLEGFIADISDRKQSEQALQQSEAQLRQQAQSLEKAMQELQTAQMQMVQSEKMSALG